ncbi:MAG TPA: FAD/NAD(P)-binding oxidoreductase, partial [Deinococcales bacterium]|nr:FAD/NAD(P)-binding oxidoreductase [Deinococcales bacterium]
ARRHSPDGIVIIGAGAAGSAAAEMLRRCGYQGPLTLIDEEDEAPYDRPQLSKGYLAGEVGEDDVPLRQDGFYAEHGIDVVRGRVAGFDPERRTVSLEDGTSPSWDALLLATGSEPRRLDIPGSDLPHVFTLRSRADSRTISDHAANAQDAVVVGASFIGLETAAALRQRGLNDTVVAPDDVPLGHIFGPELGGMVRELHEEHGVKFRLGTGVEAISEAGVTLEGGGEVPADLVVVGIGVSPRLELAEVAGLEVDGGVMVDGFLETAARGVYAAGDIARWPSAQTGNLMRIEHWVVAQRHGQAAARNMLGAREPFTAIPYFWSKHYSLSIRYSGHAEEWDDIVINGAVGARSFSAAFR